MRRNCRQARICGIFVVLLGYSHIASADPTQISCTNQTGPPPTVRAEGIAELVGDLVLSCTGGTPTPVGSPVPLANFQVFLNTNVTSRLIGPSGLSEATLLIDDPSPAAQILCMPQGSPCPATGGAHGTPNVFSAVMVASDSLVWRDVPFDPPGAGATRILRVTNVRGNAGPQMVMSIVVTCSQPLVIDKLETIVAVAAPGLVVKVAPTTISQCPSNGGSGFGVTIAEGFPASFRPRNKPDQQTVPGTRNGTESGFYAPNLFTATPAVGLADFGTRIRLVFTPVAQGVQLFVPVEVLSGGLRLALVQTRLYGDASGLPLIAATGTVNGIPVAEVSHQGDQGYAVYQVLSSDSNVIETAAIPVAVRFTGNPPSFPPLGAVTVSVSLAPADRPPVSIVTASLQAPLPRFVDTSVPQVAIVFEKCDPAKIMCAAEAVPATVRSEGITELVGDLVLRCTGGFPTPKGAPIPAVDVQIVLNTSVTSRILAAQSGLTEATLLIDEPNSGPAAPPLIPCLANLQGMTCPETGTGFASPSPYFTQPNVFLGGQSASSTIVFKGVPFDPPGPGGTLVLRITNVRANARLTTGPSIMMTVSFTVPQIDSPPLMFNSTLIVATLKPGLVVADITPTHLSKCRSLNPSLLQSGGTGKSTFHITVSEMFATSFKTRFAGGAQNVPDRQYNTESGFYDPNVFPLAVGLADSGTGLRVSFRNLDDGTHLFVPLVVPQTGSLSLRLVKRPGGLPLPGTVTVDGVGAAEILAENGTASADYEVMAATPILIETVNIPVAVAYKASIVQSPPGAVTVSVSFAPGLADSAIPRFDDTSKAQDAFVIDSDLTCLTCTATAVPPLVRAEGITELVGDLVLRCTGGLPTEKGATVPAVDVQIALNTSVTSRILAAQSGLSEAMLLIGEPNSGPAAPPLFPCTANPCRETGPSPYFTQPNVFLSAQSTASSIVFRQVPIDQPGLGATLVLRITNVRANARQRSGAPIMMTVSVTVPETEIPPPIVNSTVTVATLQAGLGGVDVTNATLSKCDLNAGLLQTGGTGKSTFQIKVSEGFASSLKPRGGAFAQDVPGVQYNTESGFYDPSVFPPAGLADCGTVLKLRFQNVGEGAHLFVPSVLQTESATLQLVEEPCGRPVHGTVKVDGLDAAEIIAGNGARSANYQVIAASATLIETVTIPVAVAFQADIGKNLPASGQVQVSVSLAPVGGLADSVVPRFEDTSKPQDAYTINSGPCPLDHGFTCTASAATPLVRVEGVAESAGDFALTCTGGVPTPAGTPVPPSNVQIFLNTNVTSRIVGSGNLSEATLMIDEPYPGSGPVPDAKVVPARIPPQVLCTPQGNPCPIVGDGFGTPYETIPGTPTVYLGRQTAAGSVSWNGVPIDAPGLNTRAIRITNVRANASQLGVSSTSGPTEITMSISVTGSQQVTIDNQPVAFIQPGLIVGGNTNASGKQCASQNTPLIASSDSSPNHNGPNFNITVQEGFASSFKRRNIALTPDGTTFPSPSAQNIPGYPYNTESGFYNTALFTATPVVGLSDFGTRIRITFNNIQNGTTYFVPTVVPLTKSSGDPSMPPQPPSPVASGFIQGQMILVQTDQAGNSALGFTAVAPTGVCGVPVAPVTASGGQGYAVYEVVNSDVNAVETATVPVCVAFIANTGANLPGVGKSTVNVSFAPVGGLADFVVPRFADTSKPQDAFAIDPDCPPELPPLKALNIERVLQLNNVLTTIAPVAPPNILAALAGGALEIREILTFNPLANTVNSVTFPVPTGTPFPTPGGIDILGSAIARFILAPDKTYVTKNSVMFSGIILTSSDTWFGNFTGSPAVISFGLTNDTPPKITNVVDLISGTLVAWSASATGTVTFSATTPPQSGGGGTAVALTPANQQGGSLAGTQVADSKPLLCDNTIPHNAFAINPGRCNPLISLCQGCSFVSDTITNIATGEYRNRIGLPGENKGY